MDFAAARRNMVECQLRTNQVTDAAVLGAMGALPRERFVPEPLTTIAYIDEDLDIGNGRFLTEPMVLGRLLQAMAPNPEDVAMCIGCGTGYAVAVLSRLCGAVFALESDTELATRASGLLLELGIDNAFLVEGALEAGWRKEAPYNVILFDGAVSEVPRDVLDQLADGGRLAAVFQSASGMGTATLLEKRHGQISRRVLFDAQIPVLSGFEPKANFVF
jgi:protein-L-isoaspartate(D-aspartate) O-methyltransferase